MKSPFSQKTRLVFHLLLQAAVLCDLSFATGSDGFQALHVFDGRDYEFFAQGDQVDSGVIIGSDGKIFGTTADTLYTLHGTIYSLNTDGSGFSRVTFVPDGFPVSSGLVETSSGMMYGTTKFGGVVPVDATGPGTIFAFSPVDGTVKTVHVFVSGTEGASPIGPLYADDDGWLYGVTNMGGVGGRGVVYGFKPADGQFKVLHSFGDIDAGGFPSTGVTKGSDGRLYGVAAGGEHSDGIFFGVGRDGSGFEILRHFRGADGSRPLGRPLQTADGTFYGSAFYGGTGGGVVYAIRPDGSGFRIVHRFDYISDGAAPMGALLLGADGRLYGAASDDGPTGYGTIYSVNPDGTDFRVLHAFDGLHDVSAPLGDFVTGPDGRIYGTAHGSSALAFSSVFAIAPGGPAKPVVLGATSASVEYYHSFEYRIVATNGPTSFGADRLPPGLTLDADSGLIHGIAGLPGTFSVPISATNDIGTGTGEIVITVRKSYAYVLLSDMIQAFDGTPKEPKVETPNGRDYTITYNGSSVPPSAIGSYNVVVTVQDSYVEGSASGVFRIEDPSKMPPSIKVQPEDQRAVEGGSATYSVVAEGGPPLTYQWKLGDLDLPGETGTTLTRSNLSLQDLAASVSVVVTNPFGTIESRDAGFVWGEVDLFTQQPESYTVVAGSTIELHSGWSGVGVIAIFWKKDGYYLNGQNSPNLRLQNVTRADQGAYSVTYRTALADYESKFATVTVDSRPRLINVSCRAYAGTGNDTQIMGFYVSGHGRKTLLIRGVGPELTKYSVPDPVADPRIDLYQGNTVISGNDNWDSGLDGTFAAVGAFPLPHGSKDAAIIVELDPGLYTVHLGNSGPVAQGLIEVYDVSRDLGTRLTNVSCRLKLNPGQIVILGTAMVGDPVHVIARNVGPGLAPYIGSPDGLLADPFIRVYSGQTEMDQNDDWGFPDGYYFGPVGAFPLESGSKDSAMRVLLNPGGYTIHASDASSGTGIAIIELYESP